MVPSYRAAPESQAPGAAAKSYCPAFWTHLIALGGKSELRVTELECRHLPRLQEIRYAQPGRALEGGVPKQFAVFAIVFLAVGARGGQPEA